MPRAWQPCGSSPPPLPRAADRVPCLLSRSCSSITARPSGPRLPLSRCRSRPAPWPPWPSGARAHAAAAVLHASSQEPPLAQPPWTRSRLAPPPSSTTCVANHRRAVSAMAGPAELPCRRCSLSYNPPAPTQSSPSEARGTVRPPSPLHRLFRPPERRRRLFRLARATGHCGQAATSHLRPCRGLLRARVSPAQPQHPSFAADEHRSGRNHELRRAPLLCSAREGEEDLAREEKQVQGVFCRTIDSNE